MLTCFSFYSLHWQNLIRLCPAGSHAGRSCQNLLSGKSDSTVSQGLCSWVCCYASSLSPYCHNGLSELFNHRKPHIHTSVNDLTLDRWCIPAFSFRIFSNAWEVTIRRFGKAQHEIRHIWSVLLVWLMLLHSASKLQHINTQIFHSEKKNPHTIKDDKVGNTLSGNWIPGVKRSMWPKTRFWKYALSHHRQSGRWGITWKSKPYYGFLCILLIKEWVSSLRRQVYSAEWEVYHKGNSCFLFHYIYLITWGIQKKIGQSLMLIFTHVCFTAWL